MGDEGFNSDSDDIRRVKFTESERYSGSAQLGDNSAILEMLFLIKNLNMTYKEASELDVKERKMLVAAVAKYLGLESPRTEEK